MMMGWAEQNSTTFIWASDSASLGYYWSCCEWQEMDRLWPSHFTHWLLLPQRMLWLRPNIWLFIPPMITVHTVPALLAALPSYAATLLAASICWSLSPLSLDWWSCSNTLAGLSNTLWSLGAGASKTALIFNSKLAILIWVSSDLIGITIDIYSDNLWHFLVIAKRKTGHDSMRWFLFSTKPHHA